MLTMSSVREGLVFVCMDQDDMLSRTAQHQIKYPPRVCSRTHYHSALPGSRPPPIVSIRHYNDGTTSTRSRNVYWDDHGHRDPFMPPEFYFHPPPDLNVIAECSGDDEEPIPFPTINRTILPTYRGNGSAPNRIGTLPFEDENDSRSDDDDPSLRSLGSEEGFHRLRRVRPNRGTSTPLAGDAAVATGSNSISLNETWDAHAQATEEAVRAVDAAGISDLLPPLARFYIEKKKNKCTLRFDPPVTGRFILLKMWSSRYDPGSNIDIQTVVARGYHGPRYFPNVEVR